MASQNDTVAGKEVRIDHEFKSHQSVFWPAARGEKTFEYRRDDRGGYEVGQTVRLRLWHGDTGYADAPPLDRRITNILRGGEFELPEGYCILALAPLAAALAAQTVPTVPEEVRLAFSEATDSPVFVHDFAEMRIVAFSSCEDIYLSFAHPNQIKAASMGRGISGTADQARKDATALAAAWNYFRTLLSAPATPHGEA